MSSDNSILFLKGLMEIINYECSSHKSHFINEAGLIKNIILMYFISGNVKIFEFLPEFKQYKEKIKRLGFIIVNNRCELDGSINEQYLCDILDAFLTKLSKNDNNDNNGASIDPDKFDISILGHVLGDFDESIRIDTSIKFTEEIPKNKSQLESHSTCCETPNVSMKDSMTDQSLNNNQQKFQFDSVILTEVIRDNVLDLPDVPEDLLSIRNSSNESSDDQFYTCNNAQNKENDDNTDVNNKNDQKDNINATGECGDKEANKDSSIRPNDNAPDPEEIDRKPYLCKNCQFENFGGFKCIKCDEVDEEREKVLKSLHDTIADIPGETPKNNFRYKFEELKKRFSKK